MDDIVKAEIESQLTLDTDLLLQILGSSLSIGASPGTSTDGRAILANVKRTHRERICADVKVQAARKYSTHSKVLLVAAVVDCIAGAVTGVSPITVAVLIVREGLDSLCGEHASHGR